MTGFGVVGSFPVCLTTKISNYVGIAKSPHGNKSMIQILTGLPLMNIFIIA